MAAGQAGEKKTWLQAAKRLNMRMLKQLSVALTVSRRLNYLTYPLTHMGNMGHSRRLKRHING